MNTDLNRRADDLPAPLTPANCNLKGFGWYPVDVDRMLKSETWVLGTGDERAAAIALWFTSWQQVPAASLPKDDRMLAHLSQSKNWKKVKAHALRGWVEASDGRYYHPVVAEKALEAWIEKLANSISGATGNAKRWNVEVDVSELRSQFMLAVRMLSAIAPESQALKKKIVVTIVAASRGESPPDSPPDSPPYIPPDNTPESGGDRNREGLEREQTLKGEGLKPLNPTPSGQGLSAPTDLLGVVPPPPAPPKRAKDRPEPPTSATWLAYSTAYRDRYGVDPVRNATVNGQLAQLVARLGAEEAPPVAAFYLTHRNQFYVQKGHPVGLLLQDCEKLRTEWVTQRQVTVAQARQEDQTQTNLNAFGPLLAEARARRKAEEDQNAGQ